MCDHHHQSHQAARTVCAAHVSVRARSFVAAVACAVADWHWHYWQWHWHWQCGCAAARLRLPPAPALSAELQTVLLAALINGWGPTTKWWGMTKFIHFSP